MQVGCRARLPHGGGVSAAAWRTEERTPSPDHEDSRTPCPVVPAGPVQRAAGVRPGRHRPDARGRHASRPGRAVDPRRLGLSPHLPPRHRPRPAGHARRAAPARSAGGGAARLGGLPAPVGVAPAEPDRPPGDGLRVLPLAGAAPVAVLVAGNWPRARRVERPHPDAGAVRRGRGRPVAARGGGAGCGGRARPAGHVPGLARAVAPAGAGRGGVAGGRLGAALAPLLALAHRRLHHLSPLTGGHFVMRSTWLLAVVALVCAGPASRAEVKTRTVNYEHNGTKLRGHLAWDDAASGKRPGVLVVHEWWGLDDYARKRAAQLAAQGYVAFACDMYGEGKTTKHPREAGAMAGEVRKNLDAWQGRAKAALKVLQEHEQVDGKKLA